MSYLTWRPMVYVCILTAISSLYAADAVVLIDQNRAQAGYITPDDAPGFPVTISQSGSYRLSGNLTVPDVNTTAIKITADFVTLDLNGFSIIGPAVCAGSPIKCTAPGEGIGVQAAGDQPHGARGVRVINGSVRGMGRMGIWMTGDGSFVARVNVDGNTGGGMSVAGSVIESAATQNGSFGIIGTTVRDSTALQNLGDGIILATGGVATGNSSSDNGGYGLYVQGGTATGNTLFFNKSFGISALCPSSIVGNTIVASGPGSIETSHAGCVLANNATRP